MTPAKGMEARDATARREESFSSLSPQLKIAARYVLDMPEEVALHSMREVAQNAGVQPTTMLRLAKSIGFRGYAEFRDTFRDRLRGANASYAARARQLQTRNAEDGQGKLVEEIISADMANISQTFANASAGEIAAAAETLAHARRISVIGLRKCFPVAFYFHYATRMFRSGVELVQGYAGTFADDLAGLGPEDCMLAISFQPYTRETAEGVQLARQAGVKLVVITDSPVSPLAEGADHVFVVANSSPSFFRSLVAAMSLVQALVAFLVAHGGEEAVEALGVSEKRRHALRAYMQGGDA